ncbi:ATP-dependent DNA helicase DinG [Salinisphaera sp. P385]|uniref:ATP-dependent DNA helicase DinG n=1 Tax=Spectribacter acetivorans TaxID=3075603 RepID=A0ABU3BBA1_9GAMM|nr:ATP-dependent DNA helicase DinG [Salinisphaera sp. P385]MDT0618538.1 ATP-dependent DNA helicase DinG [Salinisphaera sp. P385]
MHETLNEEIESYLDNLGKSLPGFHDRPSQRELIADIHDVVAGWSNEKRPIGLFEAPCGVGKSASYSLGAIPRAKADGLTVIISTGTVALQEQLFHKDLPDLQRHAGMEFDFEMVKGRGRYLCLSKLAGLTGYDNAQGDLLRGALPAAAKGGASGGSIYETMRQAIEGQAWDGQRDSFPGAIDDEQWRPVTTDRNGCLGERCRFFDDCSFYKARRRVFAADVLVVNHDLLLSDLALGGGKILPDPEGCVLILDEGHQIPDKALRHFEARAHVDAKNGWIDAARRTAGGASAMIGTPKAATNQVDLDEALVGLERKLKELHVCLSSAPALAPDDEGLAFWRFPKGVVPDGIRDLSQDCASLFGIAGALVRRQIRGLNDVIKAKGDRGEAETAAAGMGEVLSRLEREEKLFGYMAQADADNGPPRARWIHARHSGRSVAFVLESSPISAARELSANLWEKFAACVVTSATIRCNGKFDRFIRRAGLGQQEGLVTKAIASPFNYRQRSMLHLPAMRAEPPQGDVFEDEVALRINQLVDPTEGTLVLFCSKRQMKSVADRIEPGLRDRVLMQGEAAREVLLETHRKRVEKGQGSILFGLASMAEGLDLPGAACTHVVITKLAFTVPDSPIEATAAEWLESMGLNPFMLMSMPDASLKLVQATGRLLRTEEDWGRVTILDRRLVTKRYGQAMLTGLPDFAQVIDAAEPAGGYRPPRFKGAA